MEFLEHLNKALSLELTAFIQYSQHSYLVRGTHREVYRTFFREQAAEAQTHAHFLGDKIVALGGVPTVEPAMIKQSTDLREMLVMNLELEREAYDAYLKAWEMAGEVDLPTKFWLEEQLAEEKLHIEELEKMTADKGSAVEKVALKEAV